MKLISRFMALARLTALEGMRQPIALLLLGGCVLFIGLLPFLISHTLGDAERLVRNSALATQFVSGLIFAVYAACSAFVREIRSGTAATVLTKPVSRETFFLAKFTGVAMLVLLFCMGTTLATILTTRMAGTFEDYYIVEWRLLAPLLATPLLACAFGAWRNFRKRRSFNSSAFGMLLFLLMAVFAIGLIWDAQGNVIFSGAALPLYILPAAALLTSAVLILAGVAVAAATRFDTVPTLSICGTVFLLGLISDYMLGGAAIAGHHVAMVFYAVLPNWQHLWLADALGDGAGIPVSYLTTALTYAGLYLAGILTLGMMTFRHMEVK